MKFKFRTYVSSLKGIRSSNQDTHLIHNNRVNYMWSIFDGHGGDYVSNFLRRKKAKYLLDKKYPTKIPSKHITKSYNDIQKALIEEATKKKKRIAGQGSTSLTAIITKNRLQVINVGDCRAVLCDGNNVAKDLSDDHKPELKKEKKRINKLGGRVVFDKEDEVHRIMDLSVSRAFGDLDYIKFVTHRPTKATHMLKETDKFLILGCDGLWDVMSSQDAVNFVLKNKKDSKNIAKSLASHAINKLGSTDNVSVIVVFLYPQK